MREILLQNNRDLDREVQFLLQEIENTSIPNELVPFRDWLYGGLKGMKKKVNLNFLYLKLQKGFLGLDLIEVMGGVANSLRDLSDSYLSPILRYQNRDLFFLKVIHWLHSQHKPSAKHPFALLDGNFAISPALNAPLLYFLPASSLNNFLHIPLIFHEFGHFLYAYHEKDMDALATKLQEDVWKVMLISDDYKAERRNSNIIKFKQVIVTWREWIQEFFCDAVGLAIGGKSYLKTFSLYMRMLGIDQFQQREENMADSTHPLTWLRTRFLANRAKSNGWEREATQMEEEWNKIANSLNIKEEHHGYYHEVFDPIIMQTLDDMLAIAKPITGEDYLSNSSKTKNIIQLTHTAWEKFAEGDLEYRVWEQNITLLSGN